MSITGLFCLQVKNFLISSQVDKEFITKNINITFLWTPEELVHETVNYCSSLEGKTLKNISVTLFLLADGYLLE